MATTVAPTFNAETAAGQVAKRCKLPPPKVKAAVSLLESGNTIPFIARYRKERTGSLDEEQLRDIEDALAYYRDLAARKTTVLKTVEEQGKLTDALREAIVGCDDRKRLEELYLPFKPKKRTRGSVARERGLEPLAVLLKRQIDPEIPRERLLAAFVNPDRGVPDADAALRGACDIVAEDWADNVQIRAWLREQMKRGKLVSRLRQGRDKKSNAKYQMYFKHREALSKVPSHRFLAMKRGESEGVLSVGIELDEAKMLRKLTGKLVSNFGFMFCQDLVDTVADCYKRLLFPAVQSAVLAEVKEAADEEAIRVFARNLRKLLLSPPAGQRVVLGIDPGFKTGCKVAVVDATGKFLDQAAIYPTAPHNKTEEAKQVITELVGKHNVELIAIGTGTASRETDAFVTQMLRESSLDAQKVSVNESGASVYSASKVARAEFPDLDVTVRGAISIARRLQDPLAELVKIDPKSIGVGQYQHDVNQSRLRKALDREVESCVDSVGVDLNTASPQLLRYVSGIGPKLAESICKRRDGQGAFQSRGDLRDVEKLGEKAFQQAAGFLRVRSGTQPLDNSAVHPEAYYVVEKMAAAVSSTPGGLIGNTSLLGQLQAESFVDDQVGLPTIQDILSELEKPGRDPRSEFRVAHFAEGVNELADLKQGMDLEGVVTNVTRFGAFVDIGVHQDGLIHVSELDREYVKDPTQVLAVGDIVRVKVVGVDQDRGRISLSRKQALGS